jgi:predicted nuclease of predicted toxin-antitoxin system
MHIMRQVAIKPYLDEDVDPLLAPVLRERGIDCLSTRDAENLGHSDIQQLTFATAQGRVILTFNVRDFLCLAKDLAEAGRHHSGIIVSDHLPFRMLLRRVLVLIQRQTQTDLNDTVLWLQDFQEAGPT